MKRKCNFRLEKGVVMVEKRLLSKKKEIIVFKGSFGLRRNFEYFKSPS
jgi:hypothetical protein